MTKLNSPYVVSAQLTYFSGTLLCLFVITLDDFSADFRTKRPRLHTDLIAVDDMVRDLRVSCYVDNILSSFIWNYPAKVCIASPVYLFAANPKPSLLFFFWIRKFSIQRVRSLLTPNSDDLVTASSTFTPDHYQSNMHPFTRPT